MVQIQVNLSQDNSDALKIFKAERKLKTLTESINIIITKFFEDRKNVN